MSGITSKPRHEWTYEDWGNYKQLKTQKKEEKKLRAQQKLTKEISRELQLYPEKYPYTEFVTSRKAAEILGFSVWWGKRKRGHLTERCVTERICPVCSQITRDQRDKRIKDGFVALTKSEQVRLYEIYKEARRITKDTGLQYHVDHIRPLAAGGAHHPDNLQILKAVENLAKGSEYKGERKTYSKAEKKKSSKEFIVKKREKDRSRLEKLEQETMIKKRERHHNKTFR